MSKGITLISIWLKEPRKIYWRGGEGWFRSGRRLSSMKKRWVIWQICGERLIRKKLERRSSWESLRKSRRIGMKKISQFWTKGEKKKLKKSSRIKLKGNKFRKTRIRSKSWQPWFSRRNNLMRLSSRDRPISALSTRNTRLWCRILRWSRLRLWRNFGLRVFLRLLSELRSWLCRLLREETY